MINKTAFTAAQQPLQNPIARFDFIDSNLIGSNLISVALLNNAGIIQYVNQTFCHFIGYQVEELLQNPITLILPSKAVELTNAEVTASSWLQSQLQATAEQPSEQCYKHQQGHAIWGLSSLSVLTIATTASNILPAQNQASDTILLQIHDISVHKCTKAKLEESQRMLVTLLSNMPGMAYRCRLDNQRLMEFVSDGCIELTGYKPEEFTAENGETYCQLIHPEDRNNVYQQLHTALREQTPYQIIYRLTAANGEEKWVKEQGRGVYSETADDIALEGLVTDITKSQRLARKLAHQAAHDDLTGLANRREFEDRLGKAIDHTKRFGVPHALCYLDLDQFKIINDTVGHRAGDELLKQIAGILTSKIRSRDTLARLGGDEFGLLLENCVIDDAQKLAESLVNEIREFRFVWDGHLFQIGVSIGLAAITSSADTMEQLLSRADVACYTAKDLGRNRVHIYQVEDRELAKRHTELLHAASLQEALENNRLHLYQQPILPLCNAIKDSDYSKQSHIEVLVRLADTNNQLLPPGAFIPAAERYGLMIAIDKWVINKVLSEFDKFFGSKDNVQVAINLSGNSLNSESLLSFVKQQLLNSTALPEQICFEITETAAVSNLAEANRFFAEMKRLGCRFALDDFGSGLSSFAYLKYFPVDYLKIDGCFVRDMADDPTDHAMVAAINQIGHVMGIKTIAEYAETDDVVEALRALSVDYVQGYAIGKPVPLLPLHQHVDYADNQQNNLLVSSA